MIQNEGRDRDTDRTIGQDGGTERMTQNAMGYRKEDNRTEWGYRKEDNRTEWGYRKENNRTEWG